jgi:hypothetical protein
MAAHSHRRCQFPPGTIQFPWVSPPPRRPTPAEKRVAAAERETSDALGIPIKLLPERDGV